MTEFTLALPAPVWHQGVRYDDVCFWVLLVRSARPAYDRLYVNMVN